MEQLTIRRVIDDKHVDYINIISWHQITDAHMATINSKHEEEKKDYARRYVSIDEVKNAYGDYPENFEDFLIKITHHVLRNRMDFAPDWVLRTQKNNYWMITEESYAGVWE